MDSENTAFRDGQCPLCLRICEMMAGIAAVLFLYLMFLVLLPAIGSVVLC